jgi:hypothetical protein
MPSTSRLADNPPAPEEIVGLLADPLRRKVVALLDGVGRTPEEVSALTGSNGRSVHEQLGRLESAGMLKSADGRYVLVDDVFGRSVREAASQRLGALNDKHTQLARRYFYRNRLVQMPSEPWAVKVVLDLVAEDFEPGQIYTEREVNTTLYGWYGDWALLRRLLVDRGYLSREHGRYWRNASS